MHGCCMLLAVPCIALDLRSCFSGFCRHDSASGSIACNQCSTRYSLYIIYCVFITTVIQAINSLIQHLEKIHHLSIEVEEISFPCMESFLLWKEEEQRRTHSEYVKQCAPQLHKEAYMHYYYCNRSGKYTCKSLGKRQTKIRRCRGDLWSDSLP